MDIKSVATTAKMVIESLVVLLDGEGVDIESIKMDINGGNQKLDFKKLIDLAVSELKLIQDAGAQVPEGFVLVPKEPTLEMIAKGHDVFVGAFDSKLNGGQSLHCAYLAMIEAQEQSND